MELLDILDEIFEKSSKENLPDIHLNTAHYPILRDKNGEIIHLKVLENFKEDIELFPLQKSDLEEIIKKII
jgi:Tfp pilus assembly pilus retraction ATPase PilT